MPDPSTQALSQLRLLQLVSPALPIGGFTYSQGLEWAVEAGWITDRAGLEDWLLGLIEDGLAHLDLPILIRQMRGCEAGDEAAVTHWSKVLLASRESSELRQEELNRGRALASLLVDMDIPNALEWKQSLKLTQTAGLALAATHWLIREEDAALGYAWAWLENQVAAAVKLIPLGQTEGQVVTASLAARLPDAVAIALAIGDDEIGASSPSLALASGLHETQYTRLFRS